MRPAVHPINPGDEPLLSTSPRHRSRHSGSRAANDCTSAQDGGQKERRRRYDYRRSPSLENDALGCCCRISGKLRSKLILPRGGGVQEQSVNPFASLLVVVPAPSVTDQNAP